MKTPEITPDMIPNIAPVVDAVMEFAREFGTSAATLTGRAVLERSNEEIERLKQVIIDLNERLYDVGEALNHMTKENPDPRIRGKMQGVDLALSYVGEILRSDPAFK